MNFHRSPRAHLFFSARAFSLRSALFWITLYTTPLHANIDSLQTNIFEYYTAAGKSSAEPRLATALQALEQEAANYVATIGSDGSWNDLDYLTDPSGVWGVGTHYSRLWIMSKAYQTQGQGFYHIDSLAQKIEDGLRYGNALYSTSTSLSSVATGSHGNWWWWTIGVPMYLGPSLLLMQGEIIDSIFQPALDAQEHFTQYDNFFLSFLATGQNLIDISMNNLYAMVLTQNQEGIEKVRDNIQAVSLTTESEGIQPDYSFQQHGPLLSTGSYGSEFIIDVAHYNLFSRGTGFEMAETNRTIFEQYLLQGTRWSILHNYFDPSVIGRSITRAGYSAHGALIAFAVMGSIPSEYQQEYQNTAARILETWDAGFQSENAGLMPSSNYTPPSLTGFKIFNHSDYAVQRAPSYYLSVKMHSARTRATDEFINGEGKKSWHLSDGFMYLVFEGDEYFSNNVWPTLDWDRLPGTTVERKARAIEEGYGTGSKTFVGGAFSSNMGAAAMDFAPNTSAVTGRKSWFFFENEMACLGTGINSQSGNPIETIVDQRPHTTPASMYVNGDSKDISRGDSLQLDSVQSIQMGRIKYEFPNSPSLYIKWADQSGAWSDLGAGAPTLFTNPIFTLWIHHGVNPSEADYAYTLTPNIDSNTLHTAPSSLEILAQTDSLHAVRQRSTGATGSIFWAPGSLSPMHTNTPCALFWILKDSTLEINLSTMDHSPSTVQLTIDTLLREILLPVGALASFVGGATQLTIPTAKGQNYRITGKIASDSTPTLLHTRKHPSDIFAKLEQRHGENHLWISLPATTNTKKPKAIIVEWISPQGKRIQRWRSPKISAGIHSMAIPKTKSSHSVHYICVKWGKWEQTFFTRSSP